MKSSFPERQGGTVGAFAAILGVCALIGGGSAAMAETEITLWSHWADHESKVAWVEEAAKHFEEKNPGVKIKITWYQQRPLYQALNAALRVGQGPDIYWANPSMQEFIENGYALDLTDLINWEHVADFGRDSWTLGGKTYALPVEAYSIEIYYNKDLMKKLGYEVPENYRFSGDKFLEIVKKAKDAGITPIVAGVGDRGFPGAFMWGEMVLKMVGKDDYRKLMFGHLSYKDPRIVKVSEYVEKLAKMGAYPNSFASLKLGESHYYFHTKPGGLMFPMGAFYSSRAFNPPDKGGQPENFPLGVMDFPLLDGAACPNCKSVVVGGSYLVNAASKHPKLAAGVLNEMAEPEMARKWTEGVLMLSALKAGEIKIAGKYEDYFRDLKKENDASTHFIGRPDHYTKGKCNETFVQVINTGLPGGVVSAEKASEMMNAGCYTGK